MELQTYLRAENIKKRIEQLQQMKKGTFTWSMHIDNEKITDFDLDKSVSEAFEKARLEKIVELQKQFDAL